MLALEDTTYRLQAGLLGRLQVTARSLEDLDPVRGDLALHLVVLASAQAVDRLGVRAVVGAALGQLYPARGEEISNAVLAGLAVDVLVVVGVLVERA